MPTLSCTTFLRCGAPYSYYCNKELDELIPAARSTLEPKKRADLYARAQRLLYEDAAYVFGWAARSAWGLSKRTRYAVPRDEIDRLYLVNASEGTPCSCKSKYPPNYCIKCLPPPR
jgi:ABC-type transport system substrate-binding protein